MQNVVAEISLDAIVQNAKIVSEYANKPLIAVVKDDGYGHGGAEVARALAPYAQSFAVATVEEGAVLRAAGVQEEVLVLSPAVSAEEVLRGVAYGLTLSVTSLAAFHLLLKTREKSGGVRGVHFAVNTGMNRYGFRPERVRSACRLALDEGVSVEGVYSHYYAPENAAARESQREIFAQAAETVREYFPACQRHIAATGGVLAGGELFDCVRVGIALYGYLPAGFEGGLALTPAMKAYATVAQAGTFLGGGAGYGKAERDYGKLHTLRFGYGEGFFQAGGLGVGKLCMDACVCEGDTRFARRKCVFANAEEYARARGSSAYEALVRIGNGAVRRYV